MNPAISEKSIAELPTEDRSQIETERRSALQKIQESIATYEMNFNKQIMQGRHVIIVGDVITDPLIPAVAEQTLRNIHAKSLTVLTGNATPSVVNILRIMALKTVILDVLSGPTFDDNHYFEHADAYSEQEKHGLTKHIAAYWQ